MGFPCRALYLSLTLTVSSCPLYPPYAFAQGKTGAQGATATNPLVDIQEFFASQVGGMRYTLI